MGVSHFGGSLRETSWRRENRNRVSTASAGIIGLTNLGPASSSKNTKDTQLMSPTLCLFVIRIQGSHVCKSKLHFLYNLAVFFLPSFCQRHEGPPGTRGRAGPREQGTEASGDGALSLSSAPGFSVERLLRAHTVPSQGCSQITGGFHHFLVFQTSILLFLFL